MSLSKEIRLIYEQRQFENRQMLEERLNSTYLEHPRLKELDHEIKSKMINNAIMKIDGSIMADDDELSLDDLMNEKKNYLEENGLTNDYLNPIYHCDKCKDLGYLEDGSSCSCFIKLKSELLIEQSPLKERIKTDKFENFNLDYYSAEATDGKSSSSKDCAKLAFDTAKEYVKNFPSGENLFFSGPSGVGKTFITTCIAGKLLNEALLVCYLPASELFDIIGDYQFNRKSSHLTNYQDIKESDLLIIDDLGTELASGFVDSALFTIVNDRGLRKKSTIISTNLNLNQVRANYTDRVASRIFEQYTVIQMYGQDIRTVKRFS